MALRIDRLGRLLEGNLREQRTLLSPEGVPLQIFVASRGERLTAFALDAAFMLGAILVFYFLLLLLLFSDASFGVGATLILFLAFVVRNLYFIHFELAWQGRTPGKKICNLRVINRSGGELTPSAVIARNLTREVEFFLPLSLFFSLAFTKTPGQDLALLGWVGAIAAVPFFNRDRLRIGDMIGGTMVIAMPKRALLDDLTSRLPERKKENQFSFSPDQLAVYGTFELQVLEELLRRPDAPGNVLTLGAACEKICAKIGWKTPVPEKDIRRFLTAFYTAERTELERGQLFGRVKEDKTVTDKSLINQKH